MPWIHFTSNFNYRKPHFTIAYKAGMKLNVKTDCAESAIAQGKGVKLKTPKRGEEPKLDGNESDISGQGRIDTEAGANGSTGGEIYG